MTNERRSKPIIVHNRYIRAVKLRVRERIGLVGARGKLRFAGWHTVFPRPEFIAMTEPFISQQRNPLSAIQRATDSLCVVVSLYFSQWLVGQPFNENTLVVGLAASTLFLLAGEINSLYTQERSQSAERELLSTLTTWFATLCFLAILFFVTRLGEAFARSSILLWSALTVSLIGLVRMNLRIAASLLQSKGWATRRCAIVGLNTLGKHLAENARNNPACGMRIVGFFDDRATQRTLDELSVPEIHLGKIEELVRRAKAGDFDTIYITLPMRAEQRIRQVLEQLGDSTASVYIVPDFFVFELLHSRWTQIGGLPAVSVFETPLYGVDSWVKRLFDLTIACVGLIAISPVMLICALLVKLSSPARSSFARNAMAGWQGDSCLEVSLDANL